MSSSPFDLGDATLPPRRTATGTGNASANNNCSSYNESPNNNGNNNYDDSTNSSTSSKKKINLGDLLKSSPYESEAETYILNALEDRDPTDSQTTAHRSSRNRPNTGFSSLGGFSSAGGPDVLLPRVPEASTNVFLEEIKLGAAAATDTGSFTRMSQKDLGRGQNGLGRGQNGSDSLSEGRETADFGYDAAGTGATTNATSTPMNTATSKPPSPARPTRRRQSTTEETLVDITNALDQANNVCATPSTRHFSAKAASGSADVLAHNVSMLFQRKPKLRMPASSELDVTDSMPPTAETAPGGGATSARRWTAIWMGAKTNKDKKSDEDDGIVILSPPVGSVSPGDVEQGEPDQALPGANGAEFVDGTTSSRSKKTSVSRVRENWRSVQVVQADVHADMKSTRESFYAYCRAMLYVIVPATGIAFILFYLVENPST
jgi:hypothetical protein